MEKNELLIPPIGSEEIIEIRLCPEKYPIAFKNKVDELCEQGCFETREEAIRFVLETPIQLEIVYEKHLGLFAVESEALENGICTSPYTSRDLVAE